MKKILIFSHVYGKIWLFAALILCTVPSFAQFDKYWKIEGNITQDSLHNVIPNLGTIQNTPVLFISNGIERMRLTETGKLGIGTSAPVNLLEVAGGSFATNMPVISTLANGTAPFVISSLTLVSNLNADMVDGQHLNYFATANHSHNNMITGSGAINRIAFWDGVSNIKSDGSLTWDNNNKQMKLSSADAQCSIVLEEKINNPPAIDVPFIYYKWNIINRDGDFILKLDNVNNFFINKLGNIGVSTSTPTCKLDVNGYVKANGIRLTANAQNGYILTSDANGNCIWKNPLALTGGAWNISNNNIYRQTGNVGIGTNNPLAKLSISSTNSTSLDVNCNNVDYGYAIQTSVNNPLIKTYTVKLNNIEKFIIWGDGKMEVDNIIKAKEIEVKTNVFPDYVFNENYKLMPLDELDNYIRTNKHLPEVPKGCDVIKDGINVAQMNVLLLKKIEELTLYVIELKKENLKLSEKIDKIK